MRSLVARSRELQDSLGSSPLRAHSFPIRGSTNYIRTPMCRSAHMIDATMRRRPSEPHTRASSPLHSHSLGTLRWGRGRHPRRAEVVSWRVVYRRRTDRMLRRLGLPPSILGPCASAHPRHRGVEAACRCAVRAWAGHWFAGIASARGSRRCGVVLVQRVCKGRAARCGRRQALLLPRHWHRPVARVARAARRAEGHGTTRPIELARNHAVHIMLVNPVVAAADVAHRR